MSETRPFRDSRTQAEWDFDCIESAAYDLLPAAQPSQSDAITVSWQQVHARAKQFDGYDADPETVKELLRENKLDIVESEVIDGGFVLTTALGGDSA